MARRGDSLESELLIARVALAVVFATAAVAKLIDPARTRESLAGFGVAERFRASAAVVLPLTELALAALLLPQPTAVGAAIAAIVLLLAFSAAIARAIAHDETPDCNCFGQLGSHPVGRASLARNAVLGAVAVTIAAAGPGESVGQALSGVDALPAVGVTALVLLLAAQAAFSYQLFRQNARLLDRVRALEDGSRGVRPVPGTARASTWVRGPMVRVAGRLRAKPLTGRPPGPWSSAGARVPRPRLWRVRSAAATAGSGPRGPGR